MCYTLIHSLFPQAKKISLKMRTNIGNIHTNRHSHLLNELYDWTDGSPLHFAPQKNWLTKMVQASRQTFKCWDIVDHRRDALTTEQRKPTKNHCSLAHMVSTINAQVQISLEAVNLPHPSRTCCESSMRWTVKNIYAATCVRRPSFVER